MKSIFGLTLSVLCLFAISCSNGASSDESVDSNDPITIEANLLSMSKCGDGYYVEILASPADTVPMVKYILLDSAASVPECIGPDVNVIRTPITNSVVVSTQHMTAMCELGITGGIRAIVQHTGDRFLPDKIRDLATSGKIDTLDIRDPQLAAKVKEAGITTAICPIDFTDYYDAFTKVGVPVIPMTGYREYTGLSRAEWLLFLGALYGDFDKADRFCSEVNDRYQRLRVSAVRSGRAPKVLMGQLKNGAWQVPGNTGRIATYFSDAYATWPWSSAKTTGPLPVSLDTVAGIASDAEYWFINGSGQVSLKDLEERNPEIKSFRSYPNHIYVCDTLTTGYYNYAAYHPDRLLNDFVKIIHPGVCKTDTLYYYRQLK